MGESIYISREFLTRLNAVLQLLGVFAEGFEQPEQFGALYTDLTRYVAAVEKEAGVAPGCEDPACKACPQHQSATKTELHAEITRLNEQLAAYRFVLRDQVRP